MFHQVRVTEELRDYLRFVWWPDGDLSKDLQDYQMNVHLFGAVSSPSCANYAVKRTADDFEEKVGKETADVLRSNFYVDDCLRSENTDEDAIERLHGTIRLCALGGFRLTKIVSNSRKVLETIPEQEHSKEIRKINLTHDHLPIEHALGVQWCVESDNLGFRITLKDQPLTRRGILSTVSSIFDPLGMAAPVLLPAKKILQDLCKDKTMDWDDDIPEEYRVRWSKWRMELPLLEQFNMARCLIPCNFGAVVEQQLHSFSDASSIGFGQVSYLRQVNDKGDIHCAFVMGKARLTPTKAITIPRLELNAAVLSLRIGKMLTKELTYHLQKETYWTDSTTVLRYINNTQSRFNIFVANRVQDIRDGTSPLQWKYVDGKNNPADDGSRGLNVSRFMEQQRWIKGPEYLWKPESDWPKCPYDIKEIEEDDPEIKQERVNSTIIERKTDVLQRLEHFSKWHRLKRVIAWILRLKTKGISTHGKTTEQRKSYRPITVEELEKTETVIIKITQECFFSNEIATLKAMDADNLPADDRSTLKRRKSEVKKTSLLYRLNPFIDQDGVLRVGGRLSNSQEFSEEFKHPIILPKKSHTTTLVIRSIHEKLAHAGRGITLNELRTQYWVINANSTVRNYISNCVKCRKLRAVAGKMADLPKNRITQAPPFTYCAVDYFGPCTIREGRKHLKRYGALFTCLASRAIHIETANSLDTDSFLNALRRFIARRGPVREIASDQGTNFMAAEKELKMALQEIDHQKIQENLSTKFNTDWLITWSRNPPAASHMGGVWERQIRTVKSILTSLMHDYGHSLDDESFRTLLTEVECIVNSRPLTFPSSDPQDLDPLTPNHILTMKSKIVMPPAGNFQREDIYLRKRWRRVQYLADVFWSRWKKEYVQNLQPRAKWNRQKRNYEEGDIVLIKEDHSHRNDWPLARVLRVNKDLKGFVRSATVKTSKSTLDRPITKLVLVVESNNTTRK